MYKISKEDLEITEKLLKNLTTCYRKYKLIEQNYIIKLSKKEAIIKIPELDGAKPEKVFINLSYNDIINKSINIVNSKLKKNNFCLKDIWPSSLKIDVRKQIRMTYSIIYSNGQKLPVNVCYLLYNGGNSKLYYIYKYIQCFNEQYNESIELPELPLNKKKEVNEDTEDTNDIEKTDTQTSKNIDTTNIYIRNLNYQIIDYGYKFNNPLFREKLPPLSLLINSLKENTNSQLYKMDINFILNKNNE
jgi:hypothetical protein